MKFFIRSSFAIRFFTLAAFVSFTSVLLFWFGMNSIFESQREKEFKGERFFPAYVETLKELHKKTGLDYPSLVEVFNKKSLFPPHQKFVLKPKERGHESLGREMPPPPPKGEFLFGPPPPPGMMMMSLDEEYMIHAPPPNQGGGLGPPPKIFLFLSLGLMFCVVLLVVSTSSLVLMYFWKKQARQASVVIGALKSGNLKARIPSSNIQPLSSLVSEFNTMADEIEDLVSLLRNTDEYRKRMLQELAHDLRTPIASMKTLLETIDENAEKLDPKEKSRLLKVAIQEVAYFHRLVDDLLFLSGVHDMRFHAQKENLNLAEIIHDQILIFKETNKNLDFEISGSAELWLTGNRHLLARLLKNALSNACAYAKKRVSITVEHSASQEVRVVVSDDGPGIAEDELKSFGQKKFSRKYLTMNNEDRISIGLGAVIMKHICDLHEVKMEVKNRKNREGEIEGASLIFIFSLN